jgi:trehalose 6-phosphate phosphatase
LNLAFMLYLFDSPANILNKIKIANHALLIFDFDGTLAPIADSPEMANLPQESRVLLKILALHKHFTVAVVSGRAMGELQSKVSVPDIIYASNHGLVIQGPNLHFIHPVVEKIMPNLSVLTVSLTEMLGAIQGVIIEDKGPTLAVHYRLVEDWKVHQINETVQKLLSADLIQGKLRLVSGKKVLEIMPAVSWDKGKAVRLIIKQYFGRQKGMLPVYAGDDLTDENAFRVIKNYGGIAIYVGDGNTHSIASYFLKSEREINGLMNQLLKRQ